MSRTSTECIKSPRKPDEQDIHAAKPTLQPHDVGDVLPANISVMDMEGLGSLATARCVADHIELLMSMCPHSKNREELGA